MLGLVGGAAPLEVNWKLRLMVELDSMNCIATSSAVASLGIRGKCRVEPGGVRPVQQDLEDQESLLQTVTHSVSSIPEGMTRSHAHIFHSRRSFWPTTTSEQIDGIEHRALAAYNVFVKKIFLKRCSTFEHSKCFPRIARLRPLSTRVAFEQRALK